MAQPQAYRYTVKLKKLSDPHGADVETDFTAFGDQNGAPEATKIQGDWFFATRKRLHQAKHCEALATQHIDFGKQHPVIDKQRTVGLYRFILMVNKSSLGTVVGSVTGNPRPLRAGRHRFHLLPADTRVTLTAIPSPGLNVIWKGWVKDGLNPNIPWPEYTNTPGFFTSGSTPEVVTVTLPTGPNAGATWVVAFFQ